MKRKRSVTQRSVQRSRKKTSIGNASTSGRSVQTMNSSRTSGQVSTGNARVSRPFWRGDIEEVVVTRKDRLCRFTFELVEWIFVKHDTKIVVLGSDVNIDDTESGELAKDLLSIVTIFTARHNGLRSAENRKRRREIENTKDTDLPNARRKRKAKKVDGNREVDVQ